MKDREYKRKILEPNKTQDKITGIDKYILSWNQIQEIIDEEKRCMEIEKENKGNVEKTNLKCEDCGGNLGHNDGTHKFWKCDKCYEKYKLLLKGDE